MIYENEWVLSRVLGKLIPVLVVLGFFMSAFVLIDRIGVTSGFHIQNLTVDNASEFGSNATTPNTQRIVIDGPWQNIFTVQNSNSEIFTQTLTGTDHDTSGDVCGVVVRNHVDFDTTVGPNQSCAVYGETTSTRSHGANALINYAVRGKATGGTENRAFFCDAGSIRCDDGASLGPIITVGNFIQSAGTFGIGGDTTINGDTHITSHSLIVDTTGEFGTNLTVDNNLRVNGTSNLDGSPSSFVYMHKIDTSGVPLELSNALAPAVERITGSGASLPAISTAIVTGTVTAVTLADGTKDGQLKFFAIKSGTGSITPAHLNGGTAYSWAAPAIASLVLVWDSSAGAWAQVSVTNMTGP